jgi:hypothetical protein
VTPHGCSLRFTPSTTGHAMPSADTTDGVGLSLLMLGIDRQDRAAIGRIQRFSSYPSGSNLAEPPSVVWNVSFHEPGISDFGPLTRLRYRTITRLTGLGYPFCISAVPIPKGPLRRRSPAGISTVPSPGAGKKG